MIKGINLNRLVIAGVAALFVGFAANVQAIPTTVRSQSVNQSLQSSRVSSRNQSLVAIPAVTSTASVAATKAAGRGTVGQGNARGRGGVTSLPAPVSDQGALPLNNLNGPLLPTVPVILPKPPTVATGNAVTPQGATNVPDGGASAALLAGSFCGLALLRKKLKA